MGQAEFEPAIPASKQPKNHALDCAATGNGNNMCMCIILQGLYRLFVKTLTFLLWLKILFRLNYKPSGSTIASTFLFQELIAHC